MKLLLQSAKRSLNGVAEVDFSSTDWL